jgi:6-phosphogluconolactonase
MAMIRRKLLGAAALLVAAGVAGCATTHGPAAPASEIFYIGNQGSQLLAARLETRAGTMALIGPVADVPRPTWTAPHPSLPVLYVASQGDGKSNGSVSSFRIDAASGALTRTGQADAGGPGTTHLWVDAPSRAIVAANYAGGSTATFALGGDGAIGARVSLRKETGKGPHPRQASPHAHGAAVDPAGRYALVADLGLDKLFVYRFDRANHALLPDDPLQPRHFSAPPGTGPRHFVFDPKGRFVYLLGELTADLHVLRWDAGRGTLTPVQTLSLDAPGFAGTKSAAEIAISRDGRFVYASNRGDSTIGVYAADPRAGTLSLVQRMASGGEFPWGFAIHPGGRWMIVANQRSENLALFAVDPASGRLSDTGQRLAVPKPVNISFAGPR